MNFMASRRGFHEDGGSKGTCSSFSLPCSSSSPSSSCSTCSIQRGFVVSFTHNHQRKPGWFDNSNEDQEDDNGPIRGYPAGGVPEQPDQFMMDSSSPTKPGGSGGGDESSDGQGGGGLGVGLGVGRSSGNTEIQVIEREHMFDKVVTPSDVGKLNRLVIPKQHAEKYFPLDSSTNEKGLLLNFEDRNGKPWRFRYSYWNSSQSYVMTKGWSRFVKEKKLDAGDIVSFQRGVGEFAKDRLFIDWRRRPDAPELPRSIPAFSLPNHFSFRPGNHHHHHPFLLPPVQARESHLHLLQANAVSPHQPHVINSGYSFGRTSNHHYGSSAAGSVFYLKPASGGMGQQAGVGVVQLQRAGGGGGDGGGGGGGVGSVGVEGMPVHHHHPMVFESVPVVQGKAAAKRLRLFGVNMECPISESDECDILSSTTVPHSTIAPHPSHLSSSSYPPLPLRPYNATDVLNKGKASMSLDLDI